MRLPFWTVEREWAGETVAILGGGPSLTPAQVAACRGRCRVIAVNTAYWLAPWADILYFCDEVWWLWHHGGYEPSGAFHEAEPRYHRFAGRKVALANAGTHQRERAVRILQNYGEELGLCAIADGVYTGRNSGYQAIQLAAHLGAARVLLLGFDMRAVDGRTHWHSAHKRATPPEDFADTMLPHFASLAAPCLARGIEVLNCTPGSAIDCFRRIELGAALLELPRVETGAGFRLRPPAAEPAPGALQGVRA